MTDHRTVRRNDHQRDDVETHRNINDIVVFEELDCYLLVPGTLRLIHGFARQAFVTVCARLDLHEHHGLFISSDDVRFTGIAGPVSFDDVISATFEKSRSRILSTTSNVRIMPTPPPSMLRGLAFQAPALHRTRDHRASMATSLSPRKLRTASRLFVSIVFRTCLQ